MNRKKERKKERKEDRGDNYSLLFLSSCRKEKERMIVIKLTIVVQTVYKSYI